ncbi:zinc ribbon domain-containing protein [Aureivirga sp. CE67]|uniref:zinc ribbon domain-containing protein n=1 Tax=Aureivirga sp. CE67 TaxID=1788983 RepID=UPI0018CAA034|nr:C4-type zinc ribbon domain-containing protein [Aureivirga sp. CE67]
MAKTKEVTVEEKLRALYDLQLIDSRIDEIKNMRGELPLEIEDLEDEITGLNTRISRFKEDISDFQTEISNKNNAIEESKALVKKYKEQQKNVRNNREFDSLTKEAEFQELEIELAQKRIKEFKAKIEQKKEVIKKTESDLKRLEDHLSHKKSELDGIMAETHKEEEVLASKSEEYSQLIDEKLLTAYKRIRSKMKNGLAVVSIERGASAGSFFTIPPQRQAEIAARKRIIIDEHSGRILVDAHLAAEEKEKISALFTV